MTKQKSPSNQDPAAVKLVGVEQADSDCRELRIPPSKNTDGRLFTRDEIRECILVHTLMDPQPDGRRLSKRLQAENAILEMIANSFDEPIFGPDDIPF
jgi:hypothetical protein